MRIISIFAVLLIGLTGCANGTSPKGAQSSTLKPSPPAASPTQVATPSPDPVDTTLAVSPKPSESSPIKNSPHSVKPSVEVKKSAPTHLPSASASMSVAQLTTAVELAPSFAAGSYLLNTPDSIQRKVQWRGADITYLAFNAGREFGWAYFNQIYYEDYTARFREGYAGSPTLRWFAAPPELGPDPHTALDTPKILAAGIAQGAVAVSVSGNSWTIIGRIHTNLYSSSALEYETMKFDSAGHLISISLPGLSLSISSKAPDPLIKPDEKSS